MREIIEEEKAEEKLQAFPKSAVILNKKKVLLKKKHVLYTTA